MKNVLLVGATTLALVTTLSVVSAVPAGAADAGPHVVVVDEGSDPADVAASAGVAPSEVWDEVGGFAANLTRSQRDRLDADPAVASVKVDGIFAKLDKVSAAKVELPAQAVKAAVRRVGGLESPTARIDGKDQRVKADIAILDSGIQRDHPDLNVAGGFNCLDGRKNDWDDRDGHGTMVAGVAAALDNKIGVVGIAPGARVWAVRVADPDGYITDSAFLCGVNWVLKNSDTIEVANMSLGGDDLPSEFAPCGSTLTAPIHEAVCKMTRRGVTSVASAGNESRDAATSVPAAWPEVITVSAMADFDGLPGGLAATPSVCLPEAADDRFAFFSNYGASVDLAAPGVCITSTFVGSQLAFSDGTSFAAPFVSGAAALYIAKHPKAKPDKVRAALVARAEPGPIPGDPDAYAEGLLNVRGL